MPKSQFNAKHKGEKSESQYKQCVPLCVRYLCAGDTHSLCVVCLGARQAEAALEGGLIAHTARASLYVCFAAKRPSSHTEVSRSWGKTFSARLFIPSSDYYRNVGGTSERGYRAMLPVEQELTSYLFPDLASSILHILWRCPIARQLQCYTPDLCPVLWPGLTG